MIRGEEAYRLFLDITEEGCPCGCRYCFVKPAKEVLLDDAELARIPGKLLAHPRFEAGRRGTLLAFGSHCDLFRTQTLATQFLRTLVTIAPLGNPIQVSTKHYVRPEWADALASTLSYEKQLVVFVSCATVVEHDQYEPGTPDPEVRFRSFATLRAAFIPSCFYIKPFIPGVTDRRPEAFAETLVREEPDACCIGAMFVNPRVQSRLYPVVLNLDDTLAKHPLLSDTIGAVRPRRVFVSKLRAASPTVPMFETAVCVVARLQGRQCPIHACRGCPPSGEDKVWLDRPHDPV